MKYIWRENIKILAFSVIFSELFIQVGNILSQKNIEPLKIFKSSIYYNFRHILLLVLGVLLWIAISKGVGFFKKIRNSKRWDVLLVFSLGVIIATYLNYLYLLEKYPIINILIGTYLIFFFICIKKIGDRLEAITQTDPFFISDKPEVDEDKDALNFKNDAHAFAERVLNNFSKESMVFGLDAPWGMGKSTYLNFCRNFWKDKYEDKIIIFEFHALNYIEGDDVVGKFSGEFLKVIGQNHYIPEVRRRFIEYIKVLKGFSVFGLNFSIANDASTDDRLLELESCLNVTDRKVIVIIDDLDRLELKNIKTILDIVKKTFKLPNVTYLLCYDTENINVFGGDLRIIESDYAATDGEGKKWGIFSKSNEKIDHTKISEYFEKVVNVKKTLIVSRRDIKNYLIKNIQRMSLSDNGFSLMDESSLEYAIAAVEDIFSSEEYENYVSYIGDIRKVKRFLNIIRMLMDNLRLSETDINFSDLVHLILIYINFPHIFRKIYITETDGARGFFSLSYDIGTRGMRSQYINSKKYDDYVSRLSVRERFLLDKIFDANKFNSALAGGEEERIKANSAAFNGDISGTGKNLEDYLKLIVKNEKPNAKDAYNFHLNNIKRFLAGENFNDILSADEYSLRNGEKSIKILLRILLSNIDKVTFESAQKLIDFIVENIHRFSVGQNEEMETGLRGSLGFNLVKLLNDRGWKDPDGKQYDNSKMENLGHISRRIFGEGEFKDNGIIEKLSAEGKGVLGIYDLLIFRLFCSQDRGGDLFNLYASLAYHADVSAKREGVISELVKDEMRELSQTCFDIFENRYINSETNIFKTIKALKGDEIFGDSFRYVEKLSSDGGINLEEETDKQRSSVLTFIIYQLCNKNIDSGIGCGFFDKEGDEDKNGIKEIMNNYLFGVCFKPDDRNNFEYFIDFLLMNLGTGFDREGFRNQPSKDGYLKIFDEVLLCNYWMKNADDIKRHARERKGNKMVHTRNYSIDYKSSTYELFKLLDSEFIKKDESIKENNTGI